MHIANRLFIVAILALSALSLSAYARELLPAPVAQALSRAGVPSENVGLAAQRVEEKRPLVTFNTQKAMNPASVMKLVTTFAALDILGPTYNWRTEVYLGGPLRDGVLDGDLIFKGYGDPKLTYEQFWLLLQQLRGRGLKEIRGDIVLDRSWFDIPPHDPAAFDMEPLRPYNVGADALLLNFKTQRYRLVPSAQGMQLLPEPPIASVQIDNRLRVTQGACNDWRNDIQLLVAESADGAQLRFDGPYPLSCGERNWNIALLSHSNFVLGAFKSLWRDAGGVFNGTVRDGMAPPGAAVFAVHQSPSAAEVLRDMNKYSNNTIARQVFLTLSAEVLQPPGRYETSGKIVRDWLKQRELDMPELALENGAGLSRIERISTANMQSLLLAAYRSAVMPEFIASLPIIGRDGTASRKLKEDPIVGQAHIKTGSLSDVRSMAGFMLDREGRRIAFTFIVNHPNAAATQSAQDAFLRWLYDLN